ncbi:MAG: hypothetical protein Q7S83_02485 [bacterium]|nr:hypothetical protein [bacterium]
MKYLIKTIIAISSLAPLMAFADISGIPTGIKAGTTNLGKLISDVSGWATGLLIALSVLFVIYAAFLYLTAGGDPKNVENAKNIIIYAVIAIVIALMANLVASIAKGLVGATG